MSILQERNKRLARPLIAGDLQDHSTLTCRVKYDELELKA